MASILAVEPSLHGRPATVSEVRRILLTGMSGTGKTTALAELARRGFRTVETDDPGWKELRDDGEPIWRDETHVGAARRGR